MSRHWFGGSIADYTVAAGGQVTVNGITGNELLLVPGAQVTFWDAVSAGNQITDLLDAGGTPITSVMTDTTGAIPKFQGPDATPDTYYMWADANGGAGPRRLVTATDLGDDLTTLEGRVDALDQQVAGIIEVNGDTWILTNATYDVETQEFYRVDNTKAAFGIQLQAAGFLPGEPDLGFLVSGTILWVAQPESYLLIRGGGNPIGERYGAVGGWELGWTLTSERQMTVGGGGIEIDGYGTVPYGRVLNNTTGTALARRLVGMVRNAFTALDGYDDNTKDSWYWGYVEQYNPADGTTVAGSPHWGVAFIPAGTSPTSGVFNELVTVDSTGHMKVAADPTAPTGVATKQYVDGRQKGGEAFFTGDGSTTTFFITHGLGVTPSRAHLTALNQASLNAWYTKDSTLIGVNFATAPANGTAIAVAWTAYP